MQAHQDPTPHTYAARSAIESKLEADDDLLTTEEAAAELRLHPLTLKNWRCTGAVDLPFVKMGGNRVFYLRSTIRNAKLNGLKRRGAATGGQGAA